MKLNLICQSNPIIITPPPPLQEPRIRTAVAENVLSVWIVEPTFLISKHQIFPHSQCPGVSTQVNIR